MHCPELGDFIGAESCLDLRSHMASNGGSAGTIHPRRRWRNEAAEKEYPPAIPSLARTGNLPPHTAWVMKKYSLSDGRVVIREEKVRRHEYFQAHRSDGRLLLNLVPMDGSAGDEEKENVAVSGGEKDGGDGRITAEEVGFDNCGVIGRNLYGGFPVAVAALMPPVQI